MKKFKLFLAALAAMVGLSANAQTWTGNAPTEGTFFLYNVGAAKFLNNGDPNSEWGTNAYLQTGFGMDIVLEAAGENAYNLNTNVSNGGNSNYLANSTWCDGAATPWTFRAVEGETNVYQIINNGQYIMANEAGNDVEMVGDPAGRTISNTYWKLVSENDFKAAMQAKTYSATDPMDVSVFIKGRSFARNDGRNSTWITTHNGGNWVWIGASENKYYGNESWNNTFDVHQAITGLPDGTYEVRCSGFGTNGTTYIYGNSKQGQLQTDNTTSYGTNKEAKWKAIHEDNAFAGQTTGTFTLSGGNLTVGIKRETNQNQDWCVYDEFRLYYYGLDLSEFVAELAAAVAAAEAVEGTVPFAAYNALAAVVAEQNQTYTSAADYTAATTAIETATNTAKALQPNYSRYINVRNAVLAINNTINVSEANSQAEAATTAESLETAVQTVRTALANYLSTASLGEGETIDLTDALIDNAAPGVSGNTDYWTNSSNPGLQFNLWEYYQVSGGTTKQTIATSLPAGNYKLTAIAFTRTGYEAKLNAGENSTNIAQVASGTVNNREQGSNWIAEGNGNGVTDLVFNLSEATADLEIGLTADNSNGGDHWMCWRSFRLVYGDVFEPYTLVEGKMNADVAAAQTAADNAFQSNPSPATYMAVQEAIAAAQTSKDAYAKAATAIADAKALQANYTFVTPAAATTFAEAIAAIETPYNEGSLADADANNAGRTLGVVMVDWHAEATNTAASNYMISAWPSTYTINDWSWEGNDDGSNFKVPFFQDWVADGDSLAAKTMTGTLTGLENGLYSVTAWVRVRAKNETAVADATGITMDVNAGTAVDITEGTQVGETQFQLKEYTAEGLVKDGNLTLNFNIAAANNISWLAFKNVKYTKVRDLTPEELAVVPADLAIEATSTVFKGKTTTLIATSTTEGASIDGFVDWTSDNTNVATVDANGVVTGVAYGTANITVTSTLNAEATATCAVTVTAPLITEAENLDFADGPVKDNMITTYAKDMSTNNTPYSQMQEVNGWTFGVANGDARAAGVMAYGSSYGMGANGNTFYAPATNPAGDTGNALGMVGVWQGSVQYVQNVKLPAGAYTITVPVYRNGGASALVKNLIGVIFDDGTEHLATTTTYAQNTWTPETIKFTVTEDTYGRLSLGLNAPNKGSNDSQRLWIDGVTVAFEPFATTEEIAALNAAITTAEGHALGFDEGDYAPYKNVDALTALAAAKALDTTNPIAQSDVTSATAALTSATWTANTEEVNAVHDGTFAAAENNGAPAGWTMSNNELGGATHSRAFVGDTRLSEFNTTNSGFYIRFDGIYSDRGSMYYYGNATGYTMPLKAGVTYYAKVDIKGWGSTGKNQRMNITGPTGFSTVSQDLKLSNNADTDDAEPQQFLIVFTASFDGNYVINFQTPGDDTQKHNAIISNVELKRVPEIVLDEAVAWTPTASPSANVTLKRSFNSNWATFAVPFDIDNETLKAQFGDDVQVSTISADADNLNFSAMQTPAITANEPVIMKVSNTAGTYTFDNVEIKAATPTLTPIEGVQVIGNYSGQITMPASDDATKYYYIASNKLKYTTGTQTLKGFRAYFSVAADSPVKGFFENGYDFEGLPTAIDGLQAEGANATIYNLAGQRVNKAQKGIYIVNGKKVLVK